MYDIFGNMTYYLFDVFEYDFGVLLLIFRIIPTLIAGILYIVLASKLYKESFSVKAVKVIGWIAFAMEILNSIIYPVLISIDFGFVFYFYDLSSLLYTLFALGLLLYICAFKINTLKKHVVDKTTDIVRFCRKCGNQLINDSQFCDQCGIQIIKE